MKRLFWGGIFFCSLFVGVVVRSETLLGIIPSVSDTGLLQKRLQAPILPLPPSLSPIAAPTEPSRKPSPQEEKVQFKLTQIMIKGNTVFTSKNLEKIFSPSYQKKISLGTLRQLVDNVTKQYRSAGYILSRAILPPQAIKNGVVRVQVIEGFVSKVIVSGNPGWIESVLKQYAGSVLQSRPLQVRDLERVLLLMNDLPGVAVKAVLTPSENVSGAANLTLVTEQKRTSGYVSYDNYGTRYLGPQEISTGVTFNSRTYPGASDSLRVMTLAQTSRLEYLEYTHINPIGRQGVKLAFDVNYTNDVPAFALDPLTVVGRGQQVYADIMYPWIRSRSENFFVHAKLNYQNVSSTIIHQPFYADYFRSLILGGDYGAIDRWKGTNDVNIDVEKGFDIFGANQHLNQSRPLGVPNYLKTNVQLSRLQALPWRLSLLSAMTGQYSFEPLLATEQFSYGGPIYGRGYDPSEIVGDDGFGAKLELRRDGLIEKPWLSGIQYYLFYDAGIVWNRDGINLLPKQSATSTGLGARFVFIPQLTANLYFAKPLTHSLGTQVIMKKDPLKPRIFFQLTMSV